MLLLQVVLDVGMDTELVDTENVPINEIAKCWNEDCTTIGIAVTTEH
jgi:hypothetical protein